MKRAPHARRIGCPRTAVLFLLIAATTPAPSGGKEAHVTKVYSIPAQWDNVPVLLDVCPTGLVLLPSGQFSQGDAGSFVLWDLERNKAASTVRAAASDEHRAIYEPNSILRCLDGGRQLVGRQEPYLVLIDAQRSQDVKWVLPSRELLGPHLVLTWPGHGSIVPPVDHLLAVALAVNPANGLVAAPYNMRSGPRIFLYTAGLNKLVRTFELSQLVQDICWSPDGKRLAVLYSGEIDPKGRYVGDDPHFHPLGIPDVEVLDPQSGERQLRFFSGDREVKISFSPDGTRLCTISVRDQYFSEKGAIRIFSASSGELLKTITSRRYHLHNNFALSPDGRLIVADASGKPPWLPWHLAMRRYGERALYNKTARFVILDAKTGKVVFEHHEVTPGPPAGVEPVAFAFTPDGRRLLVDPNFAHCGFGERVDVYSLDGLR